MSVYEDITVTLTMGGRPDLLKVSLESIRNIGKFKNIIAVNDFADERCDLVFKEVFPEGLLLSDGKKRGHHGAINWLYENVDTTYVMHTEDDWVFDESVDLLFAKAFLEENQKLTSFCFRAPCDFLNAEQLGCAKEKEGYLDLSGIHEEWYGYTFNPHLIATQNLRLIGDFTKYKKERHVSRALKQKGMCVAYSQIPLVTHIGDEVSMANPNAHKKKSWMRLQFRKWINRFKVSSHTRS